MLKEIFSRPEKTAIALSLLFTLSSGCSSSKLTAKKLDNTAGFNYSAWQTNETRGAGFYQDSEGISYIALTEEEKEDHAHLVNYSREEADNAMRYFLETGKNPCEKTVDALAFYAAMKRAPVVSTPEND